MPRLHFRTKHVLPHIKPSRKQNMLQLLSRYKKGKKGKQGKQVKPIKQFSILNSIFHLMQGLMTQQEHQRGLDHRQNLLRQNDPTVRIDIKQEPTVKQEPIGSGLFRRRRHSRK